MKRKFSIFTLLLIATFLTASTVAIFYSETSKKYYPAGTYDTILKGLTDALDFGKIEYTFVDISHGKVPEDVKVLIDPSNAALTDSEVNFVKDFLIRGGKVLCAYESGLRFPNGQLRNNFAYGEFLGIKFKNWDSGKYYYITPTEEGKNIFEFKKITKFPRGFTFTFELTELARPLAYWTNEKGEKLNLQFPIAIVMSDSGVYFGENIYLHTGISEEIKMLLVNTVNKLAGMPPAKIDLAKLEKENVLSKLESLQNKLTIEGKVLGKERMKELSESLKKLKDKVLYSTDLNEIREFSKEIDLIILELYPQYSIQTRAVWIDYQTLKAVKSPEGLRKLINELADIGFNMIIPETIYKGRTISSKSSYFPQDEPFNSWNEDPLDIMIEESKKLGLEVHAWCWVFAISSGGEQTDFTRKNADWLEKDKYGNVFTINKTAWLSHSNPEVREYLLNALLEIIEKYEIDGLNLDYIRYDSDEMGFDNYTVEDFKRKTGIDPYKIEKYSKEEVLWHIYREELVNTFVEEFYNRSKNVRPELLVSADVFPSLSGARKVKKQNWEIWLKNGYVDILIPMNYRSTLEDLKILLDSQSQYKDSVYFYPGIQLINLPNGTKDLMNQLTLCLDYFDYGVVAFSSIYLDKYDKDYLKVLFRNKAICSHTNIKSILEKMNDDFENYLTVSKNLGLSESEYKDIYNFWKDISSSTDIVKLFDGLSELFFYISDNVYEPVPAMYLTDKVSRMIDIIRPRIYKVILTERYTSEKPEDMIVIENVVPLPKNVISFGKAKVDGVLDEWEKIQKMEPFRKYDTGDEYDPKTYVKVMHDEENLYILFECEEPLMEQTKKASGLRDTRTYLGDSVEIFILADESQKVYYHFVVGIDGTIYDEVGFDSKWNGDIDARTVLDSNKWYAEIRINLVNLGIRPTENLSVKMNFNRNRWRGEKPQYSGWSVTYGSYHTIERFGIITFGGL